MKRLSRIQRRILEVSLEGRIAHNLARYKAGLSHNYTPEEFLFACMGYMKDRGVPQHEIDRLLGNAEVQAEEEVEFFLRHHQLTESHGASSVSVEALIGSLLDELGY